MLQNHRIGPFSRTVWDYYLARGRHELPWRQAGPNGLFDPYYILASEIMLQQTQVNRVAPKFATFISQFPDIQSLAAAPLAPVLQAWSGLGYNRRAKFLWQAARQVAAEYGGIMPTERDQLMQLPGVGPNTAGAIMVYAYDAPEVFIETNIRTVFIHHFFKGQQRVSDAQLLELVALALAQRPASSGPREWYWALMDYGTYLKQTAGNAARNSAGYVRQSAFAGSRRQIRGQILKVLADGSRTLKELQAYNRDERLAAVLADLEHEGLIERHGLRYSLRGA